MTRSKIKTASITDDAVTTAKVNPAQTDITSVGTLTSFRSTGIDDNADALAMTIDTNETVMVGKTSSSTTTAGFEAQSSGLTAIVRDSNPPLYVGRNTNNGDAVVIRKGSTSVGSIGLTDDGIYIAGKTDTGLFLNDTDNNIYTITTGLNNRDNTTDLGRSNARFKDLYLGGSIFLGGTSSVNSIDDVETGSWTVNVQKGGSNIASPNSSHAYYIRVGDMCHFTFYWYKTGVTTSGSDQWSVGPVPFDMRAGAASGYQHIHVGYINIAGDRTGNGNHRWQANTATYFFLYGPNLTVNVSNQSVELSGAGVVRLT